MHQITDLQNVCQLEKSERPSGEFFKKIQIIVGNSSSPQYLVKQVEKIISKDIKYLNNTID